jgi:hypothetical protein
MSDPVRTRHGPLAGTAPYRPVSRTWSPVVTRLRRPSSYSPRRSRPRCSTTCRRFRSPGTPSSSSCGGRSLAAPRSSREGPKPSIEYGPSVTSDTLDTIAGWTKLTRQMIEDYASVRDYIDGELRREVYMKEEAEAVAALNAAHGRSRRDRRGSAGFDPRRYRRSAVEGLQPDRRHAEPGGLGGPRQHDSRRDPQRPAGSATYWGLTVIPAASQPAGGALVGDFRVGDHAFLPSRDRALHHR